MGSKLLGFRLLFHLNQVGYDFKTTTIDWTDDVKEIVYVSLMYDHLLTSTFVVLSSNNGIYGRDRRECGGPPSVLGLMHALT